MLTNFPYGWLEWFESLPEGVQTGILEFIDTQVPIMAACQVPAVVPKGAVPKEASQSGRAAAPAESPPAGHSTTNWLTRV